MSTSALAAAQAIPANCKAPVFPWEPQYGACFKAGYDTGSHGNLGQVSTGMVAGHGPGPVLLVLLVIALVIFMSRRGRSGSPATR